MCCTNLTVESRTVFKTKSGDAFQTTGGGGITPNASFWPTFKEKGNLCTSTPMFSLPTIKISVDHIQGEA